MPRGKKRAPEAKKNAQYQRTIERLGRWRGKVKIEAVFEKRKAENIAKHQARYGKQTN